MRCPFCRVDDDHVVDSRTIGEGRVIRRRRECSACGKRFTTYERTESSPRRVIKKDSSYETFCRDKILHGLLKACEKRNTSMEQIENIVSTVEARVFEQHDSEVSTKIIGQMVSEALRDVDHVAYVRFASVYREFKDVDEFLHAVLALEKRQLSGRAAELGEDRPSRATDSQSESDSVERPESVEGAGSVQEEAGVRRGGRGAGTQKARGDAAARRSSELRSVDPASRTS